MNRTDRELFARYAVPDNIPKVWPTPDSLLRASNVALEAQRNELLLDNATLLQELGHARAARRYYRQRFLYWRGGTLTAAGVAVAWMLFW